MSSYGDRIRSERHRLGLTQKLFAKTLGVSQATQVGYESGAHLPNVHYLAQSAALGVDVIYVMLGERGTKVALETVNWEMHDRVLKAVETWLDDKEVRISVEKKMHLVRLFLSKFLEKDNVDDEYIAATLALVA